MPPVDVGDEARRRPPRVRASAPLELLWVGHRLLTGIDGGDRIRQIDPGSAERLREEMAEFWADGHSAGVGELVVIADAAGRLFDTNLDGLLPALPLSRLDLSQIGLRAEEPGDRERFLERLERLQREPARRDRYAALMLRLWELFRPEWEAVGLNRVLGACRSVSQRLESGAALRDTVPVVGQLARKKASWGSLIDEAVEEERLVLVPGYFGGRWSIWDLPQHVVVGFNQGGDPVGDLRAEGRYLASRLRVLGDPTRLALLLRLADQPTSVGELATQFELAQPTVSAHLRSLREVSMVTSRRDRGRVIYRADRAEIGKLLRLVAEEAGVEIGG